MRRPVKSRHGLRLLMAARQSISSPLSALQFPPISSLIAGVTFASLILSCLYSFFYSLAIGFPIFSVLTPVEILKSTILWLPFAVAVPAAAPLLTLLVSGTRFEPKQHSRFIYYRYLPRVKYSNRQQIAQIVTSLFVMIPAYLLTVLYIIYLNYSIYLLYFAICFHSGGILLGAVNYSRRLRYVFSDARKLHFRIFIVIWTMFSMLAFACLAGLIIGATDKSWVKSLSYVHSDKIHREGIIIRLFDKGVLIRSCADPHVEFIRWEIIQTIKVSDNRCD